MTLARKPIVSKTRARGFAWLLVCAAAGCASSDASAVLRSQPPAALTVRVGNIQIPAGERVDNGLAFVADAARVRQRMIEVLRDLDAASRVMDDGEVGSADVEVSLDLDALPVITHSGPVNVLATVSLWLTTWALGLMVEDSSYSASVKGRFAWRVGEINAHQRDCASMSLATSFFQRNNFLSWSTLQSFVLPPFWTSDDRETACVVLSDGVVADLASQAAMFLKNDYENFATQSLLGKIHISEPVNGASCAADKLHIVMDAWTTQAPKKIAASVNGGAEQLLSIKSFTMEREFRKTRAEGVVEGLKPMAVNFIRLRVVGERDFLRTIRMGGLASAGGQQSQ